MQGEKRNGVWRMLLCGSKRRKMSQSMIATSLLCVLISVAIAVCAIGYFTFQLVVGEKGKARVDVLQQISDSNSVNRTNMVKAMDALYEDFYDDLTAPKSEKQQCHPNAAGADRPSVQTDRHGYDDRYSDERPPYVFD